MTNFRLMNRPALAMAALLAVPATALADDGRAVETVVVHAASIAAFSPDPPGAGIGHVTAQQLEARPVYRAAELLEATPGLVVTQHSGEGKAAQYFLRGFNLDHGTDLRTTVAGMLVNQRSHAHGQGWTDLNFLIPELATGLTYQLGNHHASEGDFAAAGAVSIDYAEHLPEGIASLSAGAHGFRRGLLAQSWAGDQGHLLVAGEAMQNDGPFTHPDHYRKLNGVLRYAQGPAQNHWNLTAMGYRATWNASDQIPQRAVQAGLLSRWDTVDPSDGGQASRYSVSGQWQSDDGEGHTARVNASVVAQNLALFSNFTYFLNDPIHGDQFAQPDRRVTSAVDAQWQWPMTLGSLPSPVRAGLSVQHDNIFNALLNTQARQTLSVVRQDHILETSLSAWFDTTTHWSTQWQTTLGLRADGYRFAVTDQQQGHTATARAALLSPKATVSFMPSPQQRFYASTGQGFHSQDARALVPSNANGPALTSGGLARARSLEIGWQGDLPSHWQGRFALHRLDVESELVYAGDAGSTEAKGPSRRQGVDLSLHHQTSRWLSTDADIAFTQARWRAAPPGEQHIPGAVQGVASLTLNIEPPGPWFASASGRYFGPRPLNESGSAKTSGSTTLNARLGYRLGPISLQIEGFNLTQSTAAAAAYRYTSRLPGEAAEGVDDTHFHPLEGRSLRLTLLAAF